MRFFIEEDALDARVPVDHRAKTAISERVGFGKVQRWLRRPEERRGLEVVMQVGWLVYVRGGGGSRGIVGCVLYKSDGVEGFMGTVVGGMRVLLK